MMIRRRIILLEHGTVWDRVGVARPDRRFRPAIRTIVFRGSWRFQGQMEKIPMTAEGYSTLENELKHRQKVERPRIIQQISDARTHGDLSQNAEYHAAKETQ